MACHNHLARALRLNREEGGRDAWSVVVEGSSATKVGLETKYSYDQLRVVCLTDGSLNFSETSMREMFEIWGRGTSSQTRHERELDAGSS
jgi:hypothetical protein